MADNKGKVVWECIGRSCALCKKDHKACNGQRPCSRCVGMGWESECRDVALKPRGRPRKMRPTKTTKTSLGSQDCEEGLSVSPSLFVSSFPFLPTAGREQDNFDISEKVARLTQRLNHMPSISSGLRSDASSPKVQRKRRAVGPSAAVETKRRGIVRKEEEPEEETEEEDDDVKPEPQNFDVSKDELRELCCDDDDEGLPYEMVFKVNLTSCCSASSKKQGDHNNYHKAKRSCKQSLSTSCAASSTSSTAKCSVPNKMRKETSTERRVLEQIQQDVDELGMFQFEGAGQDTDCLHNDDNNANSSPVAMMLEEGVQEDEESMAVLASGAEDFWIAQPGYPLALQQPYLFPSFNNDSDLCFNNPAALQAYLSMQDPSSFMFLKNEPMILAQEERLGRNPYFIRTPPQVRRGVPPAATATPIAVPPPRIAAFYSADDGMEEEGSW